MTLTRTIAAWLGGRAGDGARVHDGRRDGAEERKGYLGPSFVLTGPEGEAFPRERGYEGLARTGFMRNPVAYRGVRLIAEASAAIPLLLYEGERELEAHPILDILAHPNPLMDGAGLIETLCGHLLLSGDAFLEALVLDGLIKGLHALRPDRVRVVADADGWPEAFEYRVGTRARRIAAEGDRERPSALLHLKLFHPLDDGGGFAPLAAAQDALALHNAASEWNRALLKNSARPSGALIYRPPDGGNLSPDQFDRLKAELESGYAGVARAGRPMLLEGGLDWKAMALSPKEMDFVEVRHGAARDIALALGVPPMLLGIPGDNTFANYAEANRAFFRLTVLPLTIRLANAIGGWLAGHHGEPRLRLAPDLDRVEGLSAEREALWRRVSAADFLSRGEKREAVGYGTEPAGEH